MVFSYLSQSHYIRRELCDGLLSGPCGAVWSLWWSHTHHSSCPRLPRAEVLLQTVSQGAGLLGHGD